MTAALAEGPASQSQSPMTPGHLTALEPISLADLVERAALLTRVDRKYVVPLSEARALVAEIADRAQVLEIDGRREFGYESTYFDNAQRESFLTAGRSRRLRWKVRTRSYLDTAADAPAHWLEVKTRSGRGQTLKQRIQHQQPDRLTGEGVAFVAGILGDRVATSIVPTLVTDYRRSTLFLADSSSRVTIDVDLGWSAAAEGPIGRPAPRVERPLTAIVETKTGSTPSAMDRLLWSRGHRPVRISKYGVGMAALHPDLPRLKWHRVMSRDLGLTH